MPNELNSIIYTAIGAAQKMKDRVRPYHLYRSDPVHRIIYTSVTQFVTSIDHDFNGWRIAPMTILSVVCLVRWYLHGSF
jgi:hypothetical protein